MIDGSTCRSQRQAASVDTKATARLHRLHGELAERPTYHRERGYANVMRRDALFAGSELRTRLQVAEKEMADEVQAMDAARLLNTDVAGFADYLVNRHGFEVPRLLTDKIYVDDPAETKVDVSQDWNRMLDRSRPFYVSGTTFTYHIPFAGDQELLLLTPSTQTTIWPEGKVTTDNEIV